MTITNTPVFPHVVRSEEDAVEQGMDLRAYFAVRAPTQIPDWFQPQAARPEPQLPTAGHLPMADREQYNALLNGTIQEDNASLPAIGLYREYMRAKTDREDWRADRERSRYFGWRWFYADQMLLSVHDSEMIVAQPLERRQA